MRKKLGYYREHFKSKDALYRYKGEFGKDVLQFLKVHGIQLGNKKVLDIGCGFGGFGFLLIKNNAKVKMLENDREKIKFIKEKIRQTGINFSRSNIRLGDACKLPFRSNYFDLTVMLDVIEHVQSPEHCLKESYRVLKKGGHCLLSSPPYYGPWGGHIKPPLTPIPIPYFHYIPKVFLMWFLKKRERQLSNSIDSDAYRGSEYYTLNKLGIAGIENVLMSTGFETVHFSKSLALPWNFPIISRIFKPFLNLKYAQEFLAGNYTILLRKT